MPQERIADEIGAQRESVLRVIGQRCLDGRLRRQRTRGRGGPFSYQVIHP